MRGDSAEDEIERHQSVLLGRGVEEAEYGVAADKTPPIGDEAGVSSSKEEEIQLHEGEEREEREPGQGVEESLTSFVVNESLPFTESQAGGQRGPEEHIAGESARDVQLQIHETPPVGDEAGESSSKGEEIHSHEDEERKDGVLGQADEGSQGSFPANESLPFTGAPAGDPQNGESARDGQLESRQRHDQESATEQEEVLGHTADAMRDEIPRNIHGTVGDSRAGVSGQDLEVQIVQRRESDMETAVKMVKAVEEDAKAIAASLSQLFSSLQSALSEVTGSSIEHMRCHSEAAGLLQDASIDAASKGNKFINACLRLNEEMKSMGSLAAQLKTLRQVVDQFEYHASRSIPRI